MTDREFAAWASERGVSDVTTEELLRYAATPDEMLEAFNAVEPAPPIYTLADVVDMTDADPYGISPRANGFVVVGGCPNGDPIAVAVVGEPGTVWYVCHETMYGRPLREVSVRVAGNLTEMFERMAGGGFPFDYFEAKDRESPSGK